MFKKFFLVACVFAAVVPLVLAQAPPPLPGLVIPLPAGMMPPPPEDGPEAFDRFLGEVFGSIAGDDGAMTLAEFREWMKKFGPPAGETGETGGGTMPCGGEEDVGAAVPRADCDGCTGNLIERTVCNSSGYNWQAISMPAGRNAGCFNVEAKSASPVIFYIYDEANPTTLLFDSDRDGLHNIGTVMGTLTHTADTVYHVELDGTRSAADAWVKVTCVDYNPAP